MPKKKVDPEFTKTKDLVPNLEFVKTKNLESVRDSVSNKYPSASKRIKSFVTREMNSRKRKRK